MLRQQSARRFNAVFLATFLLCNKYPCKTIAVKCSFEGGEPIRRTEPGRLGVGPSRPLPPHLSGTGTTGILLQVTLGGVSSAPLWFWLQLRLGGSDF